MKINYMADSWWKSGKSRKKILKHAICNVRIETHVFQDKPCGGFKNHLMKNQHWQYNLNQDKARSETGKCAKSHNSHEMGTTVTQMNGQ